MCRPKPGPRCYKTSAAALTRASRAYIAAREAVASADDTTRAMATTAAKQAWDHQQRCERDLYASQSGAAALEHRLEYDDLMTDDERDRLVRLYSESDAVRVARLRQQKLMPAPLPSESKGARAARTTLGQARDDLAHIDAQLLRLAATEPDSPTMRQLLAERATAEDRVFEAEVVYRIDAANKTPATDYLHPDELAAMASKDDALRDRLVILSHARAAADRVEAHPDRVSNTILTAERDLLDATENSADPLTQRLHSGLRQRLSSAAEPRQPDADTVRTGDCGEALYGWQEGRSWQPRTQSAPEWARHMSAHVDAVRRWDRAPSTETGADTDTEATRDSADPDNDTDDAPAADLASPNASGKATKAAASATAAKRGAGRKRPATSSTGRRRGLGSELATKVVTTLNPVVEPTGPPGITFDVDELFTGWWL